MTPDEAAVERVARALYEKSGCKHGFPCEFCSVDENGDAGCFVLARAALAAAPAPGDAWQPIETAPQDGTPVVLDVQSAAPATPARQDAQAPTAAAHVDARYSPDDPCGDPLCASCAPLPPPAEPAAPAPSGVEQHELFQAAVLLRNYDCDVSADAVDAAAVALAEARAEAARLREVARVCWPAVKDAPTDRAYAACHAIKQAIQDIADFDLPAAGEDGPSDADIALMIEDAHTAGFREGVEAAAKWHEAEIGFIHADVGRDQLTVGQLDIIGDHQKAIAAIRALAPPAPAAAREADLLPAARDVLAERAAQVTREGWTPEHDDEHGNGQMAQAAACYAIGHCSSDYNMWPWERKWWKPKDRRRDLVRAGALILAEIERLDRAAKVK